MKTAISLEMPTQQTDQKIVQLSIAFEMLSPWDYPTLDAFLKISTGVLFAIFRCKFRQLLHC